MKVKDLLNGKTYTRKGDSDNVFTYCTHHVGYGYMFKDQICRYWFFWAGQVEKDISPTLATKAAGVTEIIKKISNTLASRIGT